MLAKGHVQPDGTELDKLHAVIASRSGGDPTQSYSAKLLAGGAALIAKKLGEEAVETIVESDKGDRGRLVQESADLLYHLLVLWVAAGIAPEEVWRALRRAAANPAWPRRRRGPSKEFPCHTTANNVFARILRGELPCQENLRR